MVYTIKDVQNIYIGENIIPTEEYVLLSDWGSINKYSEMSWYGRQCLNNWGTYWQWYVQATDTFWTLYKQFDKKIVGFKVVWACTWNSYDGFNAFFFSDVDFTSGNIPSPKNGFNFDANSTAYGWSSTWTVNASEAINWNYTSFFAQNKNNSTTRVIFEWTLENWVWNIDISTTAWQSWNTTKAPSTDFYVAWFRSWRWYTWQASNFYEVIIYLQWN